MKHILDCEYHDIIMDPLGGKCRVLGRCGDVVMRSEYNRYDIAAYHFMTVDEMEKLGWKVLNKDGKEQMTLEEAAHYLNVEIITK